MSGSTWTWLGTSTAWAQAANWQLAQGDAGNGNGYPQSGDTAIIDGAGGQPLTLTGTELSGNVINLSNGAVLDFANGSTLDSASNIYGDGPSGTISVTGLFTDLGSIDVTGTNAALSIQLNGGTLLANDLVDYGLNVEQGNTLLVNGGVIQDQEIHVIGGTAIVTGVTLNNVGTQGVFSVRGGFLELQQETGDSLPLSFNSGNGPDTIKLDNPALFGGSGSDNISGFATGNTLDLGSNIIGTIEYTANSGYGNLTVLDTSGNTILNAVLSGNGLSNFTSGTFDVNASGGTSNDGFVVTQGNGGDTIITPGTVTPPSPTSWTWIGTTGAFNVNTNWSQSGGAGNANGYPINGDSAIVPSGTMDISGATLDLVSLSLGGTPGGGAIVSSGAVLEVDNGLVMLGSSLLSVDGTSAIEIGGGGTFVTGAVAIDSGVTLVGTGMISGAVDNNGEIDSSNAPSVAASSGGTLEITGSIGGTGIITLGAGSTLQLDGAVGSGQSFSFASGKPEDLVLGTPGTGFSNAITGLAAGDEIQFGNGMTISSASLQNGNTIAVDFTSGGTSGVYDLTNVSFAQGAPQSFSVGSNDIVVASTVTASPPQITGTAGGQSDIDVLSINPFSNVAITDPNVSQTETVTVTLSAAANGALTNLGGGSYDDAAGVYTVSGSASAVTAAVDGLTFVPTFEQVAAGQSVTTTFTIAVSDTAGQTATDNTTSVAASRANATQTAIYQDYETILGRTPDTPGFNDWQQQVDNGASLSDIANGLAYSDEAQTDINNLYQQVLGRSADSSGTAFWEQQLASGMSLAGVRTSLAGSGEAQGDISSLYQQELGRAADSTGLAYWEQQLASGTSLAAVAADLASSAEAQADIDSLYQQVLERPADSTGLAFWEQQLASGASLSGVRAALAGSDEAQTDINNLYGQVLGRTGDSGGIAFWQQQLAAGASLSGVRAALAASAEAGNDLGAAYQSAYGSAPDQGALLSLEARLANGTSLSAVENSLQGPLVVDTVAGQAISDNNTVQPFAAAVVTDPNASAAETATIVLTNASGTATDANGLLSGTGVSETSAGTYTLSAGSASALTAELNAVVFTPTQAQVTPGQSVSTGMNISVNDGSLSGSDSTTSVTATAVTSGTAMNFIYGSVGDDTLTATAAPDVFAENMAPQGNDMIVGFNTAQDIVQLSSAMFAAFSDVQAAMTTVGGSAVIQLDKSDSLTLQGVAAGSLQASNFRFV